MKIFPQLNCFTYVSKMKGRFDMKKIISAVISLMLALSFGASYSAADKYDYTVNGSEISAQPYYSGDVLMVPLLRLLRLPDISMNMTLRLADL